MAEILKCIFLLGRGLFTPKEIEGDNDFASKMFLKLDSHFFSLSILFCDVSKWDNTTFMLSPFDNDLK